MGRSGVVWCVGEQGMLWQVGEVECVVQVEAPHTYTLVSYITTVQSCNWWDMPQCVGECMYMLFGMVCISTALIHA